MREVVIKHPCKNCGHSPDVHAFDDYRLSEFNNVPIGKRPFRCLGPNHSGCSKQCPNFVGDAITIKEKDDL